MIGRMEHFEEYLSHLLHETNRTHLLQEDAFRYHVHPSGIHTVSSKSKEKTIDKVKRYFSLLSELQRIKLRNMYKIDFEMFGYDEKRI